MNIIVVGTGAVGGFFGGLLHNSGENVTFLARGQHLSVMQENGLKLTTDQGEYTIEATFTDQYEVISTADLILLAVKSTETNNTLNKIKPYMNEQKSLILTLQNGVDNEELLIECLGVERVLAGSSYLSSQIKEPGHVVQQGKHGLVIGGLHESQAEFVEKISSIFQQAGINCMVTDNIMRKKWEKLLWNVTFNPLSTVSEATVGEILDHEELKKVADQVLDEAMLIANSVGIPLKDHVKEKVFADANLVRGHKTSMLQDRINGKPMEIESLCGFFVKKGTELKIEVPTIKTIYSLLTFIEARR